MKSKISKLIICLFVLFSINLNASDVTPKWIDVDYSDLEGQAVSEYQLVTVTVTEQKMWWRNSQTNIQVDYDQSQLQLVNTHLIDAAGNSLPQAGAAVTSGLSNFKVEFQFYLSRGVDVESVPITIYKNEESAVVDIAAKSYTSDHLIEVGDLELNTSITNYSNDGTTINYQQHFDVVDNPSNEPFTITLKKNNMSVSGPEMYDVKFETSGANATTLDKTNYQINAKSGTSFDMIIDSTVSGLDAKNDRFEFLLYIESGDNFIRLEPTFFPSDISVSGNSVRIKRYTTIKLLIIGFFSILGLIFIISNRKPKQKTN